MNSEPNQAAASLAALRAENRTRMYARAFWGLMVRDAHVLKREFVPFLSRTLMQPLLFVFVFAYLFPKIGQGFGGAAAAGAATAAGRATFATILLPGLMAVAIILQGIAAVALPLAVEFGGTREIEDRVMAPLPVAAVAFEKIVFSSFQSIIAASVVFPLAYYIPAQPVAVHINNWPLLIVIVILSSLTAGALGLTIGTAVKPQQIGLVFSMILVPLTFLGCVYYPWASLSVVRWLQVGVLLNPLVYISEGLRTCLTPNLPHLPTWGILLALVISGSILTLVGMRGFLRRVIS